MNTGFDHCIGQCIDFAQVYLGYFWNVVQDRVCSQESIMRITGLMVGSEWIDLSLAEGISLY